MFRGQITGEVKGGECTMAELGILMTGGKLDAK
jgi:hypothetical protein